MLLTNQYKLSFYLHHKGVHLVSFFQYRVFLWGVEGSSATRLNPILTIRYISDFKLFLLITDGVQPSNFCIHVLLLSLHIDGLFCTHAAISMSFADINSITQQQAEVLAFSQTEVDNLISQCSRTDSPFLSDYSVLKKQFEATSRKKIQYQLHSDTLIEYLKAKRIPRGLRLSIRPTFCQNDPNFLIDWERILNKCSLDLITLTIKGIQTELTKLEQSLVTQKNKLESSPKDLVECRADTPPP